jgi:hypothetical protein
MLLASAFGLLIAATGDVPANERAPQNVRSAIERAHAAAPRATQAAADDHVSGSDIWMMIGVGAGLVGLQLRRKQKSLQHPLTLT